MLNPDCIEFFESGHRYIDTTIGREIPSVTQILSEVGRYKDIDRDVLMHAGQRGTYVHQACMLYDDGDLDRESLDHALKAYVDGWVKFRSDTGFVPSQSEMVVYNPNDLYCGRIDVIGEYPDKRRALIDIKTQSVADPDMWGMQLAAYAEAISINEGIKERAVVHLRGDGGYSYYTLNDYRYWKWFKVVMNFYNLKLELSK